MKKGELMRKIDDKQDTMLEWYPKKRKQLNGWRKWTYNVFILVMCMLIGYKMYGEFFFSMLF